MKGIKVRLLPTDKQEEKLWKSAGTARFIYNWTLDKQIQHFQKTNTLNKISDGILRKQLTQLKQTDEMKWLYEVSNNVAKQAVKDCCEAIEWFHKKSKKRGYKQKEKQRGQPLTVQDFKHFPKFKSKRKSTPKFYNDTDKLKVKSDTVLIEKVGWVKLAETNRIPINVSYKNPRIKHDGKYWYILVCIEQEVKKETINNDVSLGVDLGIKELAVCSDGKKYKNINKTKEVKRLKKKLKRKQREVSRKYEQNKNQGGETRYIKSSNIKKLDKEIKLIYRRLTNIRLNHLYQVTTEIVKTKPSRIVVENLNVQGMMKNRHLSKAIQEQCFYKFIRILTYKCEWNNIELVKADRFYPSSKMCSKCDEIKKDLKLKDRIFVCSHCGNTMDRDKNAAINLSKYNQLVMNH